MTISDILREQRMIGLLSVFVSLLSVPFIRGDIVWTGNVGAACDFVNNDLSNARTSSEDCLQKCNETAACTHFTWTLWNGGTCWLKKGLVYKDDAFSTDTTTICGVVVDRNDTDAMNQSPSSSMITIVTLNGGRSSLLSPSGHYLSALLCSFMVFLARY